MRDEAGEEFVIMKMSDIEELDEENEEMQLSLAQAPITSNADDVLERINEELALYQLQQVADDQEDHHESVYQAVEEDPAPPMRIRFEPIGGDLSPDLQD